MSSHLNELMMCGNSMQAAAQHSSYVGIATSVQRNAGNTQSKEACRVLNLLLRMLDGLIILVGLADLMMISTPNSSCKCTVACIISRAHNIHAQPHMLCITRT